MPGSRDQTAATPYGVLVHHFFDRFFDTESLADNAEPTANLGPLLGLLAMPGAFLVLILMPLTLTGWGLVTFRYFLISLSMIVMAFVMVLHWDALFPDRRDYLILTPLPVRPATVFAAKITAVALFLGVFLIDVNLFGTLFWPGIDTGPDPSQALWAHALAVIMSGLFGALTVGALQGLLVACLSPAAFRTASTVLQTLLISLLVLLLCVTPSVAHALQSLAAANHPALQWFPGFWFLGVYEQLRPATRNQVLYSLGDTGFRALALSAALFVLTWLPGYRLHARKFADVASVSPSGPGRFRLACCRVLDTWLLPNAVQRATFHFIGKTIARSRPHRVFLAAYGGFGVALAALGSFSGPAGLLQLPFALSFVLISGLRAAFNFPAELRANWAFRMNEFAPVGQYMQAIRKWIIVCGLLPLAAVLAVFAPLQAVALAFAVSLPLMELMFLGFHKVPFTCSSFPGRVNLIGLGVIYLFGLTMYSRAMASLTRLLSEWPAAGILGITVVIAAWIVIGRYSERESQDRDALDYDNAGNPFIQTIGVDSR